MGVEMPAYMTKSQLVDKISELQELAKKDVKGMMEALAEVGYKELKKNGTFVVPGFAKFVVVKKAATKARKGINPFTGQETMFKAKPARKVVKARPVKAIKDFVAGSPRCLLAGPPASSARPRPLAPAVLSLR